MQENVTVYCPYCGESTELFIDYSGGISQEYYEDCPVCCHPWEVHVQILGDDTSVDISRAE